MADEGRTLGWGVSVSGQYQLPRALCVQWRSRFARVQQGTMDGGLFTHHSREAGVTVRQRVMRCIALFATVPTEVSGKPGAATALADTLGTSTACSGSGARVGSSPSPLDLLGEHHKLRCVTPADDPEIRS